jgi:hypothetical protein
MTNLEQNGEQLKLFPLKSGMTGLSTFSTTIKYSLKFLAMAIRQKQAIKGIQIGKEEVKLSLLDDDMILYLRDPKNSTKKLL